MIEGTQTSQGSAGRPQGIENADHGKATSSGKKQRSIKKGIRSYTRSRLTGAKKLVRPGKPGNATNLPGLSGAIRTYGPTIGKWPRHSACVTEARNSEDSLLQYRRRLKTTSQGKAIIQCNRSTLKPITSTKRRQVKSAVRSQRSAYRGHQGYLTLMN